MLGLLLILSNIQRGLERDGRLGDSTRRMLIILKALIFHHHLGSLRRQHIYDTISGAFISLSQVWPTLSLVSDECPLCHLPKACSTISISSVSSSTTDVHSTTYPCSQTSVVRE